VEEKTFFEYEGVKVTNARFVVDGQTFAMGNVTSVNPLAQPPKRLGGFLVLLIGLAVLVQNPFFGVPVIALAAFYLYKQRTVYHVMLRTSGGETKALTTHQKEYLNQVVAALNNAIVHRG
jgi:Family of unknown function (DUF6232)